jgi:hypothetical protein
VVVVAAVQLRMVEVQHMVQVLHTKVLHKVLVYRE